MSFTNLAKKRCSIRAYDPDPVEPDKIAAIVEAAHVAPSAANRQPVRLIQVESAEGLANLGRYANLYGAPLAFIVCADAERAWKRPVDGMVSTAIDASITCDHMMIEATDLGLGSVWICAFDPAGVREHTDRGPRRRRMEEPRTSRGRAHPRARAGDEGVGCAPSPCPARARLPGWIGNLAVICTRYRTRWIAPSGVSFDEPASQAFGRAISGAYAFRFATSPYLSRSTPRERDQRRR